MFHRFPAYFDPFTSIWEILIKMKIDMKNVDFTRFSYKYLICGFNPEISTCKLIFQKVQMILYILPIYHFFISCILNELCSSEDTCEIIRFGDKCFKIFTSELPESRVEWWENVFRPFDEIESCTEWKVESSRTGNKSSRRTVKFLKSVMKIVKNDYYFQNDLTVEWDRFFARLIRKNILIY